MYRCVVAFTRPAGAGTSDLDQSVEGARALAGEDRKDCQAAQAEEDYGRRDIENVHEEGPFGEKNLVSRTLACEW